MRHTFTDRLRLARSLRDLSGDVRMQLRRILALDASGNGVREAASMNLAVAIQNIDEATERLRGGLDNLRFHVLDARPRKKRRKVA